MGKSEKMIKTKERESKKRSQDRREEIRSRREERRNRREERRRKGKMERDGKIVRERACWMCELINCNKTLKTEVESFISLTIEILMTPFC